MQIQHFQFCTAGLTLILLGGVVTPAIARPNTTDITGTNIWNNTAPLFKGNGIDPAVVERVNRVNREAQEAFTACDSAISEAEQQSAPKPRRFARRPAPTPPVPQACVRLEELRAEAETLRATLAEIQKTGGNPSTRTW